MPLRGSLAVIGLIRAVVVRTAQISIRRVRVAIVGLPEKVSRLIFELADLVSPAVPHLPAAANRAVHDVSGKFVLTLGPRGLRRVDVVHRTPIDAGRFGV